METIIIGGDARMPALAALLRARGRDARYIPGGGEDARDLPELLKRSEEIVINWPPKARGVDLSPEALLTLVPSGARLWSCGPKHADADDPRVIDLWQDETLLLENARLTAEGAVSALMQASRRSLRDMNCLVIGYGRIGAALTELLVAMDARVVVASRTEAHRNRAIERGAESVNLAEMTSTLANTDAVLSTPPAPVLGEAELKHVKRSAMIIDLASPPYGVDLRAAWTRGLRAWREPGLPGRYSPESAALALLRAMERGNSHA